jgi:hypothetical protein
MYASDRKSCIDNTGKKEMIRFTDDAGKKHNYTLLVVLNSKELFEARNNAGKLPSGEVIVKTTDSTTASLGKVNNKCEKKAKKFASL